MTMSNKNMGQFGDTTLTKVFVGGLAWETPEAAMREHFEKYGDILEAVIISDKVTGRSKGYGFVTFKEAEAAKKACEDATPVINGRRANCNLASLGRSAKALPPARQGSSAGTRSVSSATGSHVQWYYPAGTSAFHHHQRHQAVPFYGYSYSNSPTYIGMDVSYNQRLSYKGGSYMNGHFSHLYPGQPVLSPNPLMPMYPLYHFHHSQIMGLPAHFYSPATAAPVATAPAVFSKPTSLASEPGPVGNGEASFHEGG